MIAKYNHKNGHSEIDIKYFENKIKMDIDYDNKEVFLTFFHIDGMKRFNTKEIRSISNYEEFNDKIEIKLNIETREKNYRFYMEVRPDEKINEIYNIHDKMMERYTNGKRNEANKLHNEKYKLLDIMYKEIKNEIKTKLIDIFKNDLDIIYNNQVYTNIFIILIYR